jgi:N-acetylmuramic acid 6-phosphate etherase
MQTEQINPRSLNIDRAPTLDILRLMNDEDATVPAVVRDAIPAIARAVDVIVARMERGGRLLYSGAGTSGRMAFIDAAECVPTFNTDPNLVVALMAGGERAFRRAVEGAEDNRAAGGADLLAHNPTAVDSVIGIAASGRTPYVLGAIDAAKSVGAATIGIACSAPSAVLDAVEYPIAAVTGAEVIAGSTRLKAGTAQKLILNMISTATMIRLGKVYRNRMVDVQTTNEKLVRRARLMVADLVGVSEDDAARLMEQSGGEVKTAIAIGLLGIPADEARERITLARGRLGSVIEGTNES